MNMSFFMLTKILDLNIGMRTVYACNIYFFKQRGGICITMKEQYRQYIKEMEKDGTCLGY